MPGGGRGPQGDETRLKTCVFVPHHGGDSASLFGWNGAGDLMELQHLFTFEMTHGGSYSARTTAPPPFADAGDEAWEHAEAAGSTGAQSD